MENLLKEVEGLRNVVIKKSEAIEDYKLRVNSVNNKLSFLIQMNNHINTKK